jgi:hypothetical protein
MIKEINGVIKLKRNSMSNCVCCEGNHIFSKYISELNSSEAIDINAEIKSLLSNDKENKKVKITIEIEE